MYRNLTGLLLIVDIPYTIIADCTPKAAKRVALTVSPFSPRKPGGPTGPCNPMNVHPDAHIHPLHMQMVM